MSNNEKIFIYEINTRVWLRDLAVKYKKSIELGDVPQEEIKNIASLGFNAVWLMGIWSPSEMSRSVACAHPGLRAEFISALPDLNESDICASPYAIKDYQVNPLLGGNEGLNSFRTALKKYGIKLILDFVPNHTGMDHSWVKSHPDYYIQGTSEELKFDPSSFFAAGTSKNPVVLAHGKDPYFPGWTDTAQLNYFNVKLRKAQVKTLLAIAQLCDGVRCDMAMLVMNEIHFQVWGSRAIMPQAKEVTEEFWPAAIKNVKKQYPEFMFIAEAYWMKEGPLQQMGFDYTYDKALYDWLKNGEIHQIASYLQRTGIDYQKKCLRFIENHDESRAGAVMSKDHHKSAALVISTLPGSTLYHEGQLEGCRRRVPVQLGRRSAEVCDIELNDFYKKLLSEVTSDTFRKGKWNMLIPVCAWGGNYSCVNYLLWLTEVNEKVWLTAVNYSPNPGQCYVMLPLEITSREKVIFRDILGDAVYERDGNELASKGLYLDLEPWQCHLFKIE